MVNLCKLLQRNQTLQKDFLLFPPGYCRLSRVSQNPWVTVGTAWPFYRPDALLAAVKALFVSLLLLSGELLPQHCRTNDLLPSKPYLLLSSMQYGTQSSEAEHPHQLFSARWFLVVQRVASSLLVVLVQQQ